MALLLESMNSCTVDMYIGIESNADGGFAPIFVITTPTLANAGVILAYVIVTHTHLQTIFAIAVPLFVTVTPTLRRF